MNDMPPQPILEPSPNEAGHPPVSLSKSLHETWLDHLTLLLHAAAGIEHELMVQYLYAAYSLGGEQVPADQRELVQLWQSNLLAIAKEEMGHFLTVQNILTLLGAPTLWTRGNYPWDNQYFPIRRYEFCPFTMDSLSCYVYAEAPGKTAVVANRYYGIPKEEVNRIIELVRKEFVHAAPHRVGQLYGKIVSIIKSPKPLIPDSAFHPGTYSSQASWDEWGKGYKPFNLDSQSPAGLFAPLRPAGQHLPPTAAPARIIVSQVASRTEALAALQLVGEQGEAAEFHADHYLPSHFDRFIGIYEKFKDIHWKPTRNVPNNPTTWTNKPNSTYIESEHSRNWAHLFNLRYRMLLTYLSHSYRLPPASDATKPQMRAGTLHRVFSEMYNLRAIANMLVRLPLMDEKLMPNDPRRAGPPFELPYTLALPATDDDCWRLHRELLLNSEILCNRLLPEAPVDGRQYLAALRDLDRQSIAWIDAILPGPTTRSSRS